MKSKMGEGVCEALFLRGTLMLDIDGVCEGMQSQHIENKILNTSDLH